MQNQNELKIIAHRAQLDFAECNDFPYTGFVGGRGAGKTYAAALKLMRCATNEIATFAMYAPTFSLLNDTVFRVFCEVARPFIKTITGVPKNIILFNGSEIMCRSLDDPERARGPSLRGAIWDEASLCHQSAFDIVIGCLRYEGKQGWLACTFTPKGPSHWTADVFNNPARADVKCFHATTRQNPFNPPQFADMLRRQYTSMFAQQELEGRFISLSSGFMRREWFPIVDACPKDAHMMRGWDLASTVASEGTDPDWTAGALVGLHEGVWYICDVRHDRLSPMGVENLVKKTAIMDGRNVPIRMEREGGSGGNITIDHYARHVLVGFDFAGVPSVTSKITRALPFAAAAEQGNVKLVRGAWNKVALDEFEAFGEDCQHDDICDSVSLCTICLSKANLDMSSVFGSLPTVPAISRIDERVADLLRSMSPEERLKAEAIINA